MKPAIKVKQIGKQHAVVLTGSTVLRTKGFSALIIIKTYTKETAEDWVSRLRGMKKLSVRRLIAEQGELI